MTIQHLYIYAVSCTFTGGQCRAAGQRAVREGSWGDAAQRGGARKPAARQHQQLTTLLMAVYPTVWEEQREHTYKYYKARKSQSQYAAISQYAILCHPIKEVQ